MIYQRIRDIREDNDLTQKQIADLLEITQQQYSLYESGKREIKTYQIKKLAIHYNISADFLLGLIDEPKPLYIKKQGAF